MRTFSAKKEDVNRKWYVVDAENVVLGRLATKVADVIRGKNKPTFTPHVDTGDFVIVINAEKVRLTGKKEDQKQYMFYSGFIGREKYLGVSHFRAKNPGFMVEHAVKGMLPKNGLSRTIITRLKCYAGDNHPHTAQNPISLSL